MEKGRVIKKEERINKIVYQMLFNTSDNYCLIMVKGIVIAGTFGLWQAFDKAVPKLTPAEIELFGILASKLDLELSSMDI